jgi:hypothetical protein
MNWAKGGIIFYFAVMIAIWLAAAWFLLANPKLPALFDWPALGRLQWYSLKRRDDFATSPVFGSILFTGEAGPNFP